MKKIIVSTKGFVRRHKEALVVGAALGTVAVLQARGITSLNEFLKDKDLFNEYYFNNEI